MKNLWFKRKRYGWGWVPATWQGWLAVLIYLGIMVAWIIWWGNYAVDGNLLVFMFVPVVATIILLVVCYLTGETSRWQWGDDHRS